MLHCSGMLACKMRGFTLIELLVVVAVVGVLSSILVVSVSGSRERTRDAERQSDIRLLQNAVEQYKQRYGRYPAMAPATGGCVYVDGFATESTCPKYIVGLEPFLSVLPHDPSPGTGQGYGYITNAAGSVYKIIAMRTVESEIVTEHHEFASCDFSNVDRLTDGSMSVANPASIIMCQQVVDDGGSQPNQCQTSDSRYQTSYAVWGGYAKKIGTSPEGLQTQDGRIDLTQNIICR